MIRLAWRQFRTEAVVGFAGLVLVAVVLVVTGPHLVYVFDTARDQVPGTDRGLQIAVAALFLLTPVLVGDFFGAPLIASELESGTFRLAWTQGVTRSRWLVVKLALVGIASSLLAGGLSLMAAWWANPMNIVNQNRFSPSNFGMFGIVPFGYALFAFVLGATTGVLFRKTLPALACTLAGYVGVRLAVTFWVRPYFEAPAHMTKALSTMISFSFTRTAEGISVAAYWPPVPNGWALSAKIVNRAGQAPTSQYLERACPMLGAAPGPGAARVAEGPHAIASGTGMQACIANLATKFHEVITYQPASRYWPFQAYETGLFVVLALALAGFSLWWVRRRMA